MKLSTSLVAVRKINSNVPRSNFADDELEKTAELILDAEGVINPIVLRRISLESYEVVDGHFEYYAAARAREINLRKGEMIGAFIIEPENEKTLREQIALLRKPRAAVISKGDLGLSNLENRLKNIESRMESRINELNNEQARNKQQLEAEIKEVKSQLPKKIKPLDVFNNMSLPELALKLRNCGFAEKKAAKIAESVEKERKKQPFISLNDVVKRVKVPRGNRKVKGISSDKMLDIISNCS